MYTRKSQLVSALFTGTSLLFIDQFCKNLVLGNPNFSFYVFNPWLGWEFFQNPGVAFGIPIPGWIMSIITPPIVLVLSIFLYKKYHEPKTFNREIWGLLLIIFGASSNFIDRLLFNYTIDYLRIIYSVVNLADIMILCGLLCLLQTKQIIDKN